MVNKAFQNSLTGRDSEKFTASLREGGTIHSLQDGATIEETVVTGTRDSSANYSPYFSLGGSSSRRVEDVMSASRDIGDQLFQSDPEMFSKFHFAGKADEEEGHDFKDGIGPNMKEAVKDITDRNKKRYGTTDNEIEKGADALLNISDLYSTGEIDETVVVGTPRYNDTLSNINKLETFYRNNFNKKAVNINKEALAEAITLASQKNNINADYITLLLAIETDLREKEVSSTGAKSIAQLAPIALKDVNQNFDTDYTMEDITGNLNSAVDAQAKYIKLVIKYAANAGLDSTDPSIIGEMYNVGPSNYIKGLADPSIPLSSNPRYIGTRGIERGEALGIDITTIPITEFPSDDMIPKFNQGGITTEPWGGSNASLYPPPQRPEGAEPSSVQEQTEQVFNSTPRLNEGGTPTQGIDEIVVTGKRTGKSVNNPTSVLHPNYNTWQAGMSSYIPEEIVEGDYLNARLGGGKNVFGQYKGNKTNKKSTAEEDLTEQEADYLRYTDAVESNEPKKVSIKEGFKNFVDNIVDTFSNPLDTVKDIEQESKKLVDNIIETGGLPTVNSSLNSIVNSKTGERLNDIDENTNRFFGTDTRETAAGNIRNKYGSTDKFLSSLKADTVGTLSDIGLGAVAVALGTRFGAPASTVALAPLINKYSR